MPISAVNLRCRVLPRVRPPASMTAAMTASTTAANTQRKYIYFCGGGLTRGKTLHRRGAAVFAAAIGDVAARAAAIGDVAAGAAVFAAAIGDVAAEGGSVCGDRRRCSGILVLRCNWVWRRRTVGCEFLVLC